MPEVVIVGGGLAGLACAARLSQAGIDLQLLEASDRVGGRVRTDVVDGFQLDHGFQFLPCDYPAARELLDYDLLRLRQFAPQLLVRSAGRFQPLDRGAPLPTRCPFWERMLRIFLSGEAAVPADGMAAIPRHLAERLPRGSLALQRTVVGLRPSGVELSDGGSLDAPVVVLATESSAADRLTASLRAPTGERFDAPWESAECLYFAAAARVLDESPNESPSESPVGARSPILCGDDTSGPIHHVMVLSNVAPEYAPPGRKLISVSLVDNAAASAAAGATGSGVAAMADRAVIEAVRRQLRSWFGRSVDSWTYLRTYSIPYAVQVQDPERSAAALRSVEPFGEAGPVVCGDHRESGTMQGAMNSGLRAAEAVCRRLAR